MPDYSKGKIYSIRSHQTDDIYIGSTTQSLYERLRGHKKDFKYWKKGDKNYSTSYEIVKYDDAYIELIEEHPCQNKDQLNKREGEYVRGNDCVNKVIPGRTVKEWREDNIEWVKERDSKYHEEHKEKRNQYGKKWREENEEWLKIPNSCPCGGTYKTGSKGKHKKTKKHKKYLNNPNSKYCRPCI